MSDRPSSAEREAQRRAASDADAAILAEQRQQAAQRLARSGDLFTDESPDRPGDPPLFEATTSAFGGDVDAAGDRLVVWVDRVEHLDGKGRLRSRIAIDAIDRVEVRKRLTSSTLTVIGSDGDTLVLKGVKAADAAQFRDTVVGLIPAGSATSPRTSTAEALRRIDELAEKGLLTDREVAERRSQLARGGGG